MECSVVFWGSKLPNANTISVSILFQIMHFNLKIDVLMLTISFAVFSLQVSLAKEFKFDHDLKMHVEYDDVFKPTTVVQKGKKDQSKFLVSITVTPNPDGVRICYFSQIFPELHGNKKSEGIFNIFFLLWVFYFNNEISNLQQLCNWQENYHKSWS